MKLTGLTFFLCINTFCLWGQISPDTELMKANKLFSYHKIGTDPNLNDTIQYEISHFNDRGIKIQFQTLRHPSKISQQVTNWHLTEEQNGDTTIIRQIFDNDSSRRSTIKRIKTKKGRIKKEIYYINERAPTTLHYNKKGKIVKRTTGYENVFIKRYFYNPKGKLSAERKMMSDILLSTTKYQYQEDKLHAKLFENHNKTFKVFHVYRYNLHNNIKKVEVTKQVDRNSSQFETIDHVFYKYDTNNKLTEVFVNWVESYNNNHWNRIRTTVLPEPGDISRVKISYNKLGLIEKIMEYQNGKLDYIVTYRYE